MVAAFLVGDQEELLRDQREREFCIDNLLVRILLIIEIDWVDRPRAMGV